METQKHPDLFVKRNQEIATMTLNQILVMAALESAGGLKNDNKNLNLNNGKLNDEIN